VVWYSVLCVCYAIIGNCFLSIWLTVVTGVFLHNGVAYFRNGVQADSERTPSGLQADSKRTPSGLQADSKRTPSGLQADSERTPSGLRADSERTPSGLQADSKRTPSGIKWNLGIIQMAQLAVETKVVSIRAACASCAISTTCYRYVAKLDAENAQNAESLIQLTEMN
jgi:hypothetical protein